MENFQGNKIEPPKHLYKYLHWEDAHFILQSETLIVSTAQRFLNQYRAMEVPDPTINDPREGQSALLQDREFAFGNATESERNAIREMLGESVRISDTTVFDGNAVVNPTGSGTGVFPFLSGATITGGTISQNMAVYEAERFSILSFSVGSPKDVFTVFNNKSDEKSPKYTCSIRFNSSRQFFERIAYSGMVLVPGFLPTPIKSLYRQWSFDFVSYKPTERRWSETATLASPFTKDSIYSNQKEARLVLFGSKLPDCATIWVPDINEFVGSVEFFK